MRSILVSLFLLSGCQQGTGPANTDGGGGGQDGPAPPATLRFNVETADPAAEGNGTAITFDGQGAAHLFYFARGVETKCTRNGETSKYHPAQLWHAVRDDKGFTLLSVSGTGLAEANGVSCAIDPRTGRPVVAFQGGQQGIDYCGGSDAILGRFDGQAWSLTMVADKSTAPSGVVDMSGDVVGPWSVVAFDKAGTIYVGWQDIHFGFADNDFSKADLEFAYDSGAGYVYGDEVANTGAGLYNSLTLDAAGRPVLAFSGYGAVAGVTVARRTAPKMWQMTHVVQGGAVPPSIATAPKSGKLGLAYYDATLRVLRLAESDDGVKWSSDIVDHDGDVGRYASLRYDPNDHPVIAYYKCGGVQGCDPASDALRVARRGDDGTWIIAADVDDGGDAACGTFPSLALSADGKAGVVYQCTTFDHATSSFNATVKYAREQ